MAINCYPILSPPVAGRFPASGGAFRRGGAAHAHAHAGHGVGAGHAGHAGGLHSGVPVPAVHHAPVYGPPAPVPSVQCVRVPGGALPTGPGGIVPGAPGGVLPAGGAGVAGPGGAAGGLGGPGGVTGFGTAARAALLAGGLGLAGAGGFVTAQGVSPSVAFPTSTSVADAAGPVVPMPMTFTSVSSNDVIPAATSADMAGNGTGVTGPGGTGSGSPNGSTGVPTGGTGSQPGTPTAVPEPASLLMLTFAGLATMLARRRATRAPAA